MISLTKKNFCFKTKKIIDVFYKQLYTYLYKSLFLYGGNPAQLDRQTNQMRIVIVLAF